MSITARQRHFRQSLFQMQRQQMPVDKVAQGVFNFTPFSITIKE